MKWTNEEIPGPTSAGKRSRSSSKGLPMPSVEDPLAKFKKPGSADNTMSKFVPAPSIPQAKRQAVPKAQDYRGGVKRNG